MVAGETITYERITDAFTSGVAVAHVQIRVLLAPAA